MLLSVLIPSNRPEQLAKFLDSATRFNTNLTNLVEFIIVVDEGSSPSPAPLPLDFDIKVVQATPGQTIGKLMEIAFNSSSGDFVLLCNDDVIVETVNWIWDLSNVLDDKNTLYYLNDKLFGEQLSCFPVVNRVLLTEIKFFPTKYKRYKIDDTLFNIFQKKKYLGHIVFRHTNDHGKQGYKFPDGRVYEVEPIAGAADQIVWNEEVGNRARMSRIINGPPTTTRIMIGVPTQEMARQAKFYDFFSLLDKPGEVGITLSHGQSPAKNRNLIIDQALANGFTHVFFIDDDVLVPKDALTRLLAHDKDIVTGLYLARNYPHRAFIFNQFDERGWATYSPLDGQVNGLMPVVAAGLGCCLIKTEVFHNMERPYIRLAELDAQDWCDDIGFFWRAYKAGVKMFCDLDVRCGHMATATIWPTHNGQMWLSTYDTQGTDTASVPQLKVQV